MLVAFAFVVKVVPSLMLKQFFGRKNAIAAGFLLSSRLSLIIAASAIGLRLGVITPEINTAIILVAIVTCISSPAIYGVLRKSKADDGKLEAVELDPLVGAKFGAHGKHGLDLQLVEVQGSDFPFLANKTLREARLRQKTGLTLIGVYRADGGFIDNPGGDFEVQPEDSLVLIGNELQIAKLETMGERRSTMPPPPELETA